MIVSLVGVILGNRSQAYRQMGGRIQIDELTKGALIDGLGDWGLGCTCMDEQARTKYLTGPFEHRTVLLTSGIRLWILFYNDRNEAQRCHYFCLTFL